LERMGLTIDPCGTPLRVRWYLWSAERSLSPPPIQNCA
jgi:hypothetical protein